MTISGGFVGSSQKKISGSLSLAMTSPPWNTLLIFTLVVIIVIIIIILILCFIDFDNPASYQFKYCSCDHPNKKVGHPCYSHQQ